MSANCVILSESLSFMSLLLRSQKPFVPKLPADLSKYDAASTKWLQGRYLYGIYGETPDYMPILGKAHTESRIVYALGCNAWGQASLTFAASVVPGLLGFCALTPAQAEMADAMALSRFKTLPVYLNEKTTGAPVAKL